MASERNTTDGRFWSCPKGAAQICQCGVAALGKGEGHSLRTAPCLDVFGRLRTRQYKVVGVLGAILLRARDAKSLHARFKGRGFEPQQLGGAGLAADPPIGRIQYLEDMGTFHLFQSAGLD